MPKGKQKEKLVEIKQEDLDTLLLLSQSVIDSVYERAYKASKRDGNMVENHLSFSQLEAINDYHDFMIKKFRK